MVEELRYRLDPAARLGVPAHITVLYPFVDPAVPLDRPVRRLRTILGTVRRFTYRLDRVGWFDDEVVWLAPTPAEPFLELTRLIHNAWPHLRPYGGIHESVTPHLTVGDGGALDELRRAAATIEPHLPINARAREVWLIDGSSAPGSWRLQKRFTLSE